MPSLVVAIASSLQRRSPAAAVFKGARLVPHPAASKRKTIEKRMMTSLEAAALARRQAIVARILDDDLFGNRDNARVGVEAAPRAERHREVRRLVAEAKA